MEHARKHKTQSGAWSVVTIAVASVLLFTCFLHLLPHVLSMLLMGIVALFPSGQEYLAPFGGYTSYLRGNLLPRLWDVLFSAYTWRWSWLWTVLGCGIYMVQHRTQHNHVMQKRWLRGIIVVFSLWYLLAYPVWSDPFYGTVNTMMLVVGIVLIWHLSKYLLSAKEDKFR